MYIVFNGQRKLDPVVLITAPISTSQSDFGIAFSFLSYEPSKDAKVNGVEQKSRDQSQFTLFLCLLQSHIKMRLFSELSMN